MAFTQSFTATVSEDGETITITDTSSWESDNPEGYVRSDFVRTFLLTDANGQTLDTIVLPVDSDVTTYTLTKDRWVNILFSIVGVVTFTKLQSYMFDRIFINKFQTALEDLGCCGNKITEHNINTAASFYLGALGIEPVGNATGVQSNLDVANTYIDLV